MPKVPDAPNEDYKVGRVLAKYELAELHRRLAELWLGDEDEATSLRDLAEKINVTLVREAMDRADLDPLEGEAENAFRLLTDDVSGGVRTQQRNRLGRAGVDVEQLEGDFVTHQAVHTYLTKGLGISKASGGERDPIEKRKERIQRLRSRMVAVTEQSLTELRKADDITLGEFDTLIDVRVYCQDCETQFYVADLLDEGGCDCEE